MLEIACASFWFILSTNNFTHITKMLGHLWAVVKDQQATQKKSEQKPDLKPVNCA